MLTTSVLLMVETDNPSYHDFNLNLTTAQLSEEEIVPQTSNNCQGCCSYHGGVISLYGEIICADGSSMSIKCSDCRIQEGK